MKDPRFRGLNLVTYLDDASRCIVAARVFPEATSENAVRVLKKAMLKFGTPATPYFLIMAACFVGIRRKTPTKSWQPTTVFEEELLDHRIELINSRPYHPPRQTAS